MSLPRVGSPIACKSCCGPTRAKGGDIYECLSRHCGALTHQATNPGNPAWWPAHEPGCLSRATHEPTDRDCGFFDADVLKDSGGRRQARADRLERPDGSVEGVDRG